MENYLKANIKNRLVTHYHQEGIYLVKIAILLPALIGILALSIDMAFLMSNYTRAQTVADAAAISAALRLGQGGTYTDAVTAANNALTLNGFSGTVEVGQNGNYMPSGEQSNFFQGNADYVGIKVVGVSPRFYAYMIDKELFKPKAYAVARVGLPANNATCPGVYSYATSKPIDLLQSSKFIVSGGGIYINAQNYPQAIYGSGSPVLSAEWIEYSNADAGVGNITVNPAAEEINAARETPDAAPTNLPVKSNCVFYNNRFGCNCTENKKVWTCATDNTTAKTIYPAKYTGGLRIINSTNVVFGNLGSSATNREQYYYHIVGELILENSTVQANQIIIDTRTDYNVNLDASTITGVARIYANSFSLKSTSIINITVFAGDDNFYSCGKLAVKTRLVQ